MTLSIHLIGMPWIHAARGPGQARVSRRVKAKGRASGSGCTTCRDAGPTPLLGRNHPSLRLSSASVNPV